MKQIVLILLLPLIAGYHQVVQTFQKIVSPTQDKPVKILFVGDLMLDRYIRTLGNKHGYAYIFEKISPLLSQQDLVVANLDGPITSHPSLSQTSQIGSPQNYIFTFAPETAPILQQHNIGLVNLGNNHILNFGNSGLAETLKYLDGTKIKYFGHTGGKPVIKPYQIIDFNQMKLAFINYNQFVSNALPATLNDLEIVKSRADFIIIYAHWGNEYESESGIVIQRLAKQFIDNGADLVIGTHPHVIQQTEQYKGKTIYYSLGNFIFDQYFSTQTQRGLLVELLINPDQTYATKTHLLSIPITGQVTITQ